jgi:hypothetical protein
METILLYIVMGPLIALAAAFTLGILLFTALVGFHFAAHKTQTWVKKHYGHI